MKHKGFTIVEILVVLAIIAILATITTISYAKVQIQERDSSRSATVKVLMNAFEGYYSDNGEYPPAADLNPDGSMVQLPNYSGAIADLPTTNTALYNTANYTFFAYNCPTGCPETQDSLNARPTQYIYLTTYPDQDGTWTSLATWGCKITFTSSDDPAAVLVWRQEATGQWHFVKSRHGRATITSAGLGPTAPTVCKFESV